MPPDPLAMNLQKLAMLQHQVGAQLARVRVVAIPSQARAVESQRARRCSHRFYMRHPGWTCWWSHGCSYRVHAAMQAYASRQEAAGRAALQTAKSSSDAAAPALSRSGQPHVTERKA